MVSERFRKQEEKIRRELLELKRKNFVPRLADPAYCEQRRSFHDEIHALAEERRIDYGRRSGFTR
jgi:hypothetical protein